RRHLLWPRIHPPSPCLPRDARCAWRLHAGRIPTAPVACEATPADIRRRGGGGCHTDDRPGLPRPPMKGNDHQLEHLISVTLRSGVGIAVVLGVIGGTMYLSQHGNEQMHFDTFRGESMPYATLGGLDRKSV